MTGLQWRVLSTTPTLVSEVAGAHEASALSFRRAAMARLRRIGSESQRAELADRYAASVRVVAPVLRRMFDTCTLAVLVLMKSCSAICAVAQPARDEIEHLSLALGEERLEGCGIPRRVAVVAAHRADATLELGHAVDDEPHADRLGPLACRLCRSPRAGAVAGVGERFGESECGIRRRAGRGRRHREPRRPRAARARDRCPCRAGPPVRRRRSPNTRMPSASRSRRRAPAALPVRARRSSAALRRRLTASCP